MHNISDLNKQDKLTAVRELARAVRERREKEIALKAGSPPKITLKVEPNNDSKGNLIIAYAGDQEIHRDVKIVSQAIARQEFIDAVARIHGVDVNTLDYLHDEMSKKGDEAEGCVP